MIGIHPQLQVGRAISNFYRAENDPLDNQILTRNGYVITDGYATVPAAPGFGLEIDERRSARMIKPWFDKEV